MKWTKDQNQIADDARVPIKSWCEYLEDGALKQAKDLARHPAVQRHVALMPDAHQGYGMPIGGVIGCTNAVIPNAVGVDIGCGMGAIETNLPSSKLKNMPAVRKLLDLVKAEVPIGEGHHHHKPQDWAGFDQWLDGVAGDEPGWLDHRCLRYDAMNLGTLGGGNHFIELQESDDHKIWLMLHSGSRNLGYRIASHYHKTAQTLDEQFKIRLPHKDLAYLPADSAEGQAYIRDMTFALNYARENRRRMMDVFKRAIQSMIKGVDFVREINIHHNYAALEEHFGAQLWIHRKGATSAKQDEMGIIPGSMGSSSYIVRGLGNPESFMSCSHGAGRKMGRKEASRKLSVEQCNKAMEGIVFDHWRRSRGKKKKGKKGGNRDAAYDLGEAPQAYKNIDQVIRAEVDLIQPVVKLKPLGVIKG